MIRNGITIAFIKKRGFDVNWYFSKDANQKSEGVSEVRLKKKLDSFPLETSKITSSTTFCGWKFGRLNFLRITPTGSQTKPEMGTQLVPS